MPSPGVQAERLDVITGSLQARFTELVDSAIKWPCEFHAAQSVRLKVAASGGGLPGAGGEGGGAPRIVLVASAYLEPSQIQDLGDKMDELLKIKAKSKVPILFHLRVELGDGEDVPPSGVAAEVTQVLADVSNELRLR